MRSNIWDAFIILIKQGESRAGAEWIQFRKNNEKRQNSAR